MLDLKELERNLDKALARETKESLTNWLTEKREKAAFSYLGEGAVEELCITFGSTVSFSTALNLKYHHEEYIETNIHVAIAA